MKPKRKVPDRKTSRRRRPAVRTIDQLSPLIHKFATEPDPGKAARIEKQILEGYYGRPIADLAGVEDPTKRRSAKKLAKRK
jgi:ribosomal protein L32